MTSQSESSDYNRQLIEEFRANGGQLGGRFAGGTVSPNSKWRWDGKSALLLLSTIGAKTGERRTNPLAYLANGDRWLVFASADGGPVNPDWYHNLVANPTVTVEMGTETFEATAKPLAGAERDRIVAQQVERSSAHAEYEQKTPRKIPVVALTRN